MAERLKKLGKQLLEMWNQYTNKQKTLIISVACVVILALSLLVFLMNKVDYDQLKVVDTTKEASEISELLDSKNIKNKFDTNTKTIYVESKSIEDAVLLLAKSDITTDDISIDDLLSNSLGTTNADRNLKINLYLQTHLTKRIKEMDGIDDAEVYYIPKDSDTTITTEEENTSASVMLTVNDDFKPDTAKTIATIVANAIGNTETDTIKVCDQNGNLLYGGDDLYSGTVTGIADYKQKLRNTFINNLYMLLVKSDYDDVEISPNLTFNMDKVTDLYTAYSAPEGMEQGLYSHSYNYTTENTDSSGGVPGTSSNDGTTYETADTTSSGSSTDTQEYDYLPNQRVTNTEYEIGAVVPDDSSIAIVLSKVTPYTQKELKDSGALNGTTYDAYVKANSAPVAGTVDPSIYTLVASATGIDESKITITAWDKSVFLPTTTTARNWSNYIMIALAVLIVGLLLFVVFKGVKPVEVTELEPELSVEQLLATTKENQTIEDIEFNEVSEVRRMIEKFVDEKPDAVAQLLRNWLNEDWN